MVNKRVINFKSVTDNIKKFKAGTNDELKILFGYCN
jgi:hypothetical protein